MDFHYEITASMLLDAGAFFFLTGLIYYTKPFRCRGSFRDRLFFVLLITNLLTAFTDCSVNLLVKLPREKPVALMMAAPTLFLLVSGIMPFLLFIYLTSLTDDGIAKIRRRWFLYMIPAAFVILIVLLNTVFGFLFTVEPGGRYYIINPGYGMVILPFIIYILWGVFSLWRTNRPLAFVILLFLTVRMIMSYVIPDVTSTSLFLSVLLSYLHIEAMNCPFQEEVEP